MSRSVVMLDNVGELAARAADHIARVVRGAIDARGRAMLALAGGTTPQMTYGLLAKPPRSGRIDWARTYLFFGDERYVHPEDPSSNLAMVRRSLLAPMGLPEEHVYPVPTHLATATSAAAAYETTLVEAFGLRGHHDPPRFDLILLGLGEDGHTASLFPRAAALEVKDRWVVASPPGTLPPAVDRITLAFPVLNAAREVLFLVSGRNKAEALRDVLDMHPDPTDRPAAGVRPVDGTLTWLVDRAAASGLAPTA